MKTFATIRSVVALALVVSAAACSSQSPVTPTQTAAVVASAAAPISSTFTDGKDSITITTAQLLSPADNQQIKYADQPVTLTIKNGVSTRGVRTYTFQVASDAGFATIVYSKDGVAEGAGGQTSLTIDKLPGSATYFWRTATTASGFQGPFTKGRAFVMGPPVVLQNPANASPAQAATVNGTPLLTVNNIGRTGPAGAIVYKFDLADSSSFSRILFSSTVAEQSGGQTSVSVASALQNGTFFWRVQASDPTDGLSTAFSPATSFNYQAFNMANAVILSSPSDLGSWAETTRITSINFNGYMEVDFDKRTGPDRWPDEPFGAGSIEYTLGMCVNPNNAGTWFCSAVVQMWYGRDLSASGPAQDVGQNWFYDPARWGPIAGYQPAEGETVGLFVGAGNLRGRTDASSINCPRVCERSNVAFVPFSTGGTSYSFSAGRISLSRK